MGRRNGSKTYHGLGSLPTECRVSLINAMAGQMDQARPDAPDHINGLIERVTFHNEESGFAVLQVKAKSLPLP